MITNGDLRRTFGLEHVPVDPLILNALTEVAHNAFTLRQRSRDALYDRRRNIENECGHPDLRTGVWDVDVLQALYQRDPVAGAVVDRLPEECWQLQPTVYESDDPEKVTPFEEAVDALGTSLRGEKSYYQEEADSPLWAELEQADKFSRVGTYGILLLGIDDGQDLRTPARGYQEQGSMPEKKLSTENSGPYRLTVNAEKGRKLLYLRSFSEAQAPVSLWENNRSSPRYGQPVTYRVGGDDRQFGQPANTYEVHWTRVIHLSEGQIPPMWTVYDRLLDCRKLYGGSAEMYWLGALPGLVIKTQPRPELSGMVSINKTDTKGQVEQFLHGLQRVLLLEDLDAANLAPTVVDPSAQLDAQLTAISIRLDMPKRVLMGSERGELSSSQDEKRWARKVQKRRQSYLTGRLIVPLFNRLISLGVLPEPTEGFCVHWSVEETQTPTEKAGVAFTRTQALAQYVQSGAEAMIPPRDYLTRELGYTDEEADAILESAMAAQEEPDTGSPLLGLVGGLTGVIELFKAAKEGALSEEQLRGVLQEFFRLDDARADALIADGLPEPPESSPVVPGSFPPRPGVPGQPEGRPVSVNGLVRVLTLVLNRGRS